MKIRSALLVALPLALLAACGGSGNEAGQKTGVVASFYPLAYVAGQVGGSYVDVDNLTSPGVEPHDLELRPRQVGAVQNADLVVYLKSFQPAVDESVDQAGRSDSDTVDVASVLALKQADPHVWLDPLNMIAVTDDVESALSAIDPDHAGQYAANAKALNAQLTTLDADFTAGLASCRTRSIVTSHDAFRYLADRYDLTQVPIAGIDPTNEPSPSQLADITQLVRTEKITTVFTEELVSPAIARTIAKEAGVETATLDTIEGLSDRTRGKTYLTLMRKNLDALRKANSCT